MTIHALLTRLRAPLTPAGIAARAHAAMIDELDVWPKPGLVSTVDAGSHRDMDAGTFRRSAVAIAPFLMRLAEAGGQDAGLGALRRIGLDAEVAMLATTGGINTHRGAVFALGLLCAAAGHLGGAASPHLLAATVRRRWSAAILGDSLPTMSHGAGALRRYGAGGARAEAAAGFRSALDVGLPALWRGRVLASGDEAAARVHCVFALMAVVEDTNLLHRGGRDGLAFVRDSAAQFLARGGVGRSDWRCRAEALHRAVVERGLSPGGSADLLAATLFLDAWEPEVREPGP